MSQRVFSSLTKSTRTTTPSNLHANVQLVHKSLLDSAAGLHLCVTCLTTSSTRFRTAGCFLALLCAFCASQHITGSGNGDPYPNRDGVDPETRRGQPTLDFHYSCYGKVTNVGDGRKGSWPTHFRLIISPLS